MQELDKFNCKINIIPNGLKIMFEYLNQEFDNKALDLAKPKQFYWYGCKSSSGSFKEKLPSEEKF